MNESRPPPIPIRAYHASPTSECNRPYEPDEWHAYQAYIDDYYNTNNAYWQERMYTNEDYGEEENRDIQDGRPTEEDVDANYVSSIKSIQCRNCQDSFLSNNLLHKHVHQGCSRVQPSKRLLKEGAYTTVILNTRSMSFEVAVLNANNISFKVPILKTKSTSVEIIESNVSDQKNDGYSF